jgi:hypothetical protein
MLALFDQSNVPPPTAGEVRRITAGTANRVDLNVYIGGYLAAADAGFVHGAGITRIVQMCPDGPGICRHPGVRYLVVPVDDVPDCDIRAGADAALRFIREGIRGGERVLVHCHAGVSRSATVVLLHLMVHRGHSLDTALGRLRLVRSFANPNPGFMAHLRATDARIRRLRVGDEHVDDTLLGGPDHSFIAPPPVTAADATRWRVRHRPAEARNDAALALRVWTESQAGGHAGAGCERLEPPAAAAAAVAAPGPWAFADVARGHPGRRGYDAVPI